MFVSVHNVFSKFRFCIFVLLSTVQTLVIIIDRQINLDFFPFCNKHTCASQIHCSIRIRYLLCKLLNFNKVFSTRCNSNYILDWNWKFRCLFLTNRINFRFSSVSQKMWDVIEFCCVSDSECKYVDTPYWKSRWRNLRRKAENRFVIAPFYVNYPLFANDT